jgi:NADPH:quinone reductase-like Zn-dependent oxidoreductase
LQHLSVIKYNSVRFTYFYAQQYQNLFLHMKASIYTKYGPPEVLSIQEIAQPVPKENEVLIKIHASSVNRTDCGFRSAEYVISRLFSGIFKPKRPVLGNEFAGVVEAIGSSVTNFNIGDRVFGYNDTQFGAHAEYMCTPADGAIAIMPDQMSFQEGATMCEGGHYALCDIRAAKVTAGQEVLVYGATGAIGSAAVQILKAMGARVTAVCGTAHLGLIQALGADTVLDYTRQDYTQLGQSFDLVFDSVGKTAFGVCKPVLKEQGIYISTELGKNWENIFLALSTPVFGKKKVLFPLPTIQTEDVLYLKDLYEKGKYKPLIDRSYSLDEMVEAHKYVETGQKIGNVVITVIP